MQFARGETDDARHHANAWETIDLSYKLKLGAALLALSHGR